MKKSFFKVIFILLFFFSIKRSCFGISNDFKFVIDTIGIPQYNVLGDEINERAYYTYNIFCYSNPTAMYSRTSKQRFKEVSNGKWTKDGQNGEYDIVGVDYSGGFVYNVYFPVDSIPECLPDSWNYIILPGALESWNDKTKYKYEEQINYMKNSKLLFDSINYSNNTINPYNLTEYNITPIGIGLNKVRLNTAVTWKTYGIVSVNRINNKGSLRYATLAIKPMAASASVKSELDVKDKVIIDENTDEVTIKIKYSANAINLNNYALPKHIKEISTTLYINGEKINEIKKSKTKEANGIYEYKISRSNFKDGIHTLNIKNNSYMYTEFSVDGLMQNTVSKNITIQVNPKKVVPIRKVDVRVLEKEDNKLYCIALPKSLETQNLSSFGIVEKGRNVAIKIESDLTSLENKDVEINIDKVKVEHKIIFKNNNKYIIQIKITENLNNSILSWNNYRNITNDYYKIDFNKIGKRLKNPNVIEINFLNLNKDNKREIKIDTIDLYNYNLNYIFENGIVDNKKDRKELEEWVN